MARSTSLLVAFLEGVSESEIIKVKAHYNWSMYQSAPEQTMSLCKVQGPSLQVDVNKDWL